MVDIGAVFGFIIVVFFGDGLGVIEVLKGIDKFKNFVTGELSKRKFFFLFICNK